MPDAKMTPGKDLEGFLQRKLGPLPLWAWAIVGVGAVYVYKRATASQAASVTTADTSYGADAGYPSYAGYDSGSASNGGGGVSGGSYDAGGAAVPVDTSDLEGGIPLTYSGEPIPVNVTVRRPKRRHDRNPKGGKGSNYTRHPLPFKRLKSHVGGPRGTKGRRR